MTDDLKDGLRFISLAAEVERRRMINEATAKANPEYAMPVESSGWQMPASIMPPPDSFTRQQVEAMLRIALTDRTDEWTIKSVDERVSILLAMFTKDKP